MMLAARALHEGEEQVCWSQKKEEGGPAAVVDSPPPPTWRGRSQVEGPRQRCWGQQGMPSRVRGRGQVGWVQPSGRGLEFMSRGKWSGKGGGQAHDLYTAGISQDSSP